MHVVEWVDELPLPGNGDGSQSKGAVRSVPVWVLALMARPGRWARLEGSRLKTAEALAYPRQAYPGIEMTWRQGAAYACWPEGLPPWWEVPDGD